MSGVAPEAGLVIPYVYLWRREAEAGEESGRKARPCIILVAVTRTATGRLRVAVAPITSQRPDATRSAVEIPPRVRAHLGIDAARCWAICDEYNEFDWPGVDRATTPKGGTVFGYVPDALIERIRAEMRAAQARGALRSVQRTE